jgi:hypothetical protein
VRNPFRSEAAAFRFLLLAAAALAALTAVGAVAGTDTVAAAAAVLLATVVVFYALRGRRGRDLATAPAHVGPPNERRLLVLAQEPVSDALLPELRDAADRVLVVSAPLARRLQPWVFDSDDAREQARLRVDATVAGLRALDADASGVVGDHDPVQALEDALRTFGGDAIAVSAPPGRAGAQLVTRIRERYALPVTRLDG